MPFRDHLRSLRIRAGLSQEALGLKIGGGQSLIANYEARADKANARNPDLDKVPLIAQVLGVQVQELFGEPPASSQPVGFDPETMAAAVRWLANFLAATRKSPDLLRDPYYLAAALELCTKVQSGVAEPIAAAGFAERIETAKGKGKHDRRADSADGGIGHQVPKRK